MTQEEKVLEEAFKSIYNSNKKVKAIADSLSNSKSISDKIRDWPEASKKELSRKIERELRLSSIFGDNNGDTSDEISSVKHAKASIANSNDPHLGKTGDVCFNYGINYGCDEYCPALRDFTCEYTADMVDVMDEETRKRYKEA